MFQCGEGNCIFVGHLRDYCYHLERIHRNQRNFEYTCHVCGKRIFNPVSVRGHYLVAHRAVWDAPVEQRARLPQVAEEDRRQDVPEVVGYEGEGQLVDAAPEPQDRAAALYNTTFASFSEEAPAVFLGLKYKHGIPVSVAERIHHDYMSLFRSFNSGFTTSLRLSAAGLGVDDRDFSFMLLGNDFDRICGTSTYGEARQLSELGYVAPEEIDLRAEAVGEVLGPNPLDEVEADPDEPEGQGEGDFEELELGGGGGVPPDAQPELEPEPEPQPQAGGLPADEDGKHVYHYVSILATLRAYLRHDDVVSQILAGPPERREGVFEDYTTGSLYRNNLALYGNNNHLRLLLYTDEVTVTNVLQGHSRRHKLAVVYFLVLNIAAHCQSSLKSIHLVAVCKWVWVKQYSYAVFLKRLFAELQILHRDGLDIVTHQGTAVHFTGSVVAVSADNLSAHALGGFRCSFSSGRMCRYCLVDHTELRQFHSEDNCQLRTVENVRQHARAAAGNDVFRRLYGVVSESCMYSVQGFSPVTHLPPDVMHDVLQSFMPNHIRLLLRALHRRPNQVYSFYAAREAIRNFRYHKVDSRNKPPTLALDWISENKSVCGTASEKWNLFRLLPFMIGEHIPADNIHWRLYKLGLQISDIMLAFTSTDEMLVELEELIREHHALWVELYPDCFPAKLHFLIHACTATRKYGSLRRLWTSRFESFHAYIKQILLKGRNFINETKTATERFQKFRCLQYRDRCGIPSSLELTGSREVLRVHSVAPVDVRGHVMALLHCNGDEFITKVSSVRYRGLNLFPDCYVIVSVREEGPLFFHIRQILVHDESVLLAGCAVQIIDFVDHFQAYEIELMEQERLVIPASRIVSNQVLASYVVGGRNLIRCRFRPHEV